MCARYTVGGGNTPKEWAMKRKEEEEHDDPGCFSFLICASSFPFLASFPRVLAPPLQDAREGSKEKTQGRRNRSK